MRATTFKAGNKTTLTRTPVIQPKLKVNRPGDAYEQEADAMADRVMRMPATTAAGTLSNGMIGPSIQRKCAHCEEEEKKEKLVMRKAEGSGDFAASAALTSKLGTSKGGGCPLPDSTRSFMENAFSRDFSQVRVHADGEAQHMSHSIQARAFTHGNDLYFNSGQYQPHTPEGRHLLAHELTHVVQQEGGRTSQLQRIVELRPPGKGEASAFDRVGELIDRLNEQHPEAITYSLEGNTLRCEVLDEAALTRFDSEMRRFIENEDVTVPLRLITSHGLARARNTDPFEPVAVDDYDSGYVDMDDLLASDRFGFQSNLLHFVTERFVTRNYAARMGTRFGDAEFDRAHAAGQQAEAALFRDVFSDPTIQFNFQETRANGVTVVAFRSRAERYRVFLILRPASRLLLRSAVSVRTADGRTLTVDEFLAERRARAAAPVVQPKLYVNTPGDRFEREADTMADRVMRMSHSHTPVTRPQAVAGIQRKCAQCEDAEQIDLVMRKAENGGGLVATPALTSRLSATKGSGTPLPASTKRFMENAFSADFSRVSIHSNSDAAAMSQSIQAHAFTHGNDIYFNSGRYSPHTREGQHLLAHELTHTLQQGDNIRRSTGTEAGSGGTASGTGSATGSGTRTGGLSVDVLAAVNPEDFLVRAAAQELGVDIRVSSMENMIDQLQTVVPGNGCLSSLNIYNHGNPSIQMVAGDNKVKNADGTTTTTPISGFSLNWLSTATNQGALNRLRNLFCCNGTINWYGCSTIGVWASGGTRTDAEIASDSHRYTGTFGDWYHNIPEALARGAFEDFKHIGAVNAQMWADATCTNLTAATDFTNWRTRDGRVTRTTIHGGGRFRYSPRASAACTCDATTGRVSGSAASAADLATSASQLREQWLRPTYDRYTSVLGREPVPPVETPAQAQERQRQATERQQLGQQIRTAVLGNAGIASGAAPANAAEALQVVNAWGVTTASLLTQLPNLAAATAGAQSGSSTTASMLSLQRAAEAALTPNGRETFMEVLATVQREPLWADHFTNNTIYIFPDITGGNRYRGYTQTGTRTLTDGRTVPFYVIHLNKGMLDNGERELASALLVHELSHTRFEGVTGEAMEGFLMELANLIADEPQIAALRGTSATGADRDRQVRRIRQILYEATAYAEEEIFVHLQQLTHQPDISINNVGVSGPVYIRETVTEYMRQLLRIGLPTPVLRQVITNLAAQTRSLYDARIAASSQDATRRRLLEANRQLALLTLRIAYDEARRPPSTSGTP